MAQREMRCRCGQVNVYNGETGKTTAKVLGAGGAGVGAWVGSGIGLAAMGTAMSAALPLALIACIWAYSKGRKLAAPACVNCKRPLV